MTRPLLILAAALLVLVLLHASSTPKVPAPQVPPQAKAAGFTRLAFDDEFTSNDYTPATGTTLIPGAKWYPYYWASPAAQSGRVTIASGTLTLTGGNITTTPTAAWSTGPGTALKGSFFHGYFECRMQFDPKLSSYHAPVWPAFWMFGLDAQAPIDRTAVPECDIFEAWPSGAARYDSIETLHQWFYRWKTTGAVTVKTGQAETASSGGQNQMQGLTLAYPGQPAPTESAIPNDGQYHTYGCLWTSTGPGQGRIAFYYDNYLVAHEYGVTSLATGKHSHFPALEQNAMSLILQGNNTQPIHVTSVHAWVAPSTK